MKRRLMGTGYTCLKMRASCILQILSSDTYELSIVCLDYISGIKIEFITYNISKKNLKEKSIVRSYLYLHS